jgi:lysophospholipase L1-like esterase
MLRRTLLTFIASATLAAFVPAGRVAPAAFAQALPAQAPQTAAPSNRFEPEIQKFEAADRLKRPAEGGTVFVGSSSIRRWDSLENDFPGVHVINRGFGGSEASDVVRYLDRVVLPYRPSRVVVYAGDNDLARGKSPSQIVSDFRTIAERVHRELPKAQVVFLAIKPSLARWHLVESTREANALLQQMVREDRRRTYVDVFTPMLNGNGTPRPELFVADGLHLTPEGYALWTRILTPVVSDGSGQ